MTRLTPRAIELLAKGIADAIPLSSGRYLKWEDRHEDEREPYREIVRNALAKALAEKSA